MEPELWQLLGDGAADDEVAAIIRLGQQSVFPAGVRVLTQFGDICTIRLRRIDIPRLNGAAEVAVMEAGDTYFAPDLELNLETISETLPLTPQNTDERRPADQTATGCSTVVGVVDWGFDFCHPDFRKKDGSTRILALWDQRNTQKPGAPQPFGYGMLHEREAIDAALRQADPYKAMDYHPADADTGIGCHATHVASIAAGSGGGGRPSGIAPEADLVFVQNAPWGENTSEKLGDSVTLLEAIDFIFRIAGDRPCVINLSMGRHGEQHDGSTLIEQGLDAALRAAPGRAICMSNGNYFDKHIHAAGQLRPTEHHDLIVEVNEKGTTYNEVEVWYSWRDRITAELRGPDDALVARIDVGERVTLHNGGIEVGKAYHRAQEPNNLDNHIDIYLYKTAQPGQWTIRLIALDVVDGRFHAWIERDGLCPKCQARFRPEDAVPTCTTGTICNGLRTLAVGAYDNHDEDRRIAHFSSAGPTRDGRLKPDLCAPGVSVLAARSTPREPTGDVPMLTRMSGTSMAAPHVTGCVALMFEVAPRRLRIEETHNLLLQSAERVKVQDEVPDRIGIGFLDINAAVRAARELPDRGITPLSKSHIPPPSPRSPPQSAPQPRAAQGSERVGQSVGRMPAFAASEWQPPVERTPSFGARGTDVSDAEVLDRIYPEVAPDLAEDDLYPCAGVLSASGQARRAQDIRRRRHPRPQLVAGKPLCPGESHIAHSGPGGATIDLLIWNFDIDGSYLKTQHEAALDQVIAAMHAALRGASPTASSFSIQLSGFASRTGDAAYNAALATEREDAVQAYLAANWERFAGRSESPIAPVISFARNPGGFDPAAPPARESAQARSARIIAVPAGAPVPPPRPFPKPCGTLTVWISAFIPRDVPDYTFTVPAGPHKGKTAIPCPTIALPANWHCRSRGYLTDQRDFSDSPTASVRMRSVAEIGLIAPGLIHHPGAEHVTSGTTEIDKESGEVTCAENADMSGCSFDDVRVQNEPATGNYTIKLKVKAAASDPCVNLAANIDYEGEIGVYCSPRGNLVMVGFNGLIDAFPAFEMYAHLNGITQTLFRSPPPPGNTVVNLVGGANRRVGGIARFEGCLLSGGEPPRTAENEVAASELDPTTFLLGLSIASQLSRPLPNQQAQPVKSAEPLAPGDEPRREESSAEMASSASEAAFDPEPAAVLLAPAGPRQAEEALAALRRAGRPAAVFNAVTARRDARLLERLHGAWLLLAGPGEPLPAALEPGDLILRRALGEPDLGHAFAVVDATMLTADQLPGLGLRGEGHGGGWLVHVAEDRPGYAATNRLCRAVVDARGRVPFNQLILRPTTLRPNPALGDAEVASGVPCATDLSPAALVQRGTDIAARRNPRPQMVPDPATGRSAPFCPGQFDLTQTGPEGATIDILLWNFDIDGSYLKRQHEAALDRLVVELHGRIQASGLSDPARFSYTLHLSGFASRTGDRAHNTALATAREGAAEQYLRAHMEDAGAIPEAPIAPQVFFRANPGGFDPTSPPALENPRARSVRIVAVPFGSPLPPPLVIPPTPPAACIPLLSGNPSSDYFDYVQPPTTGLAEPLINGRSSGGSGPDQDLTEPLDRMQEAVAALGPGDSCYLSAWIFEAATPLTAGPVGAARDWGGLLAAKAATGVKVRILMTDFDPILGAWATKVDSLAVQPLNTLIASLPKAARDNLKYVVSMHPVQAGALRSGLATLLMPGAPLRTSIYVASHHQKFMVCRRGAQLTAFCGGLDIESRKTPAAWRYGGLIGWHDLHLRLTGPITRDVEKEFVMRWNREKDRSRRAAQPDWAGYETLAATPLAAAERAIGNHRLQMTRTVSEDATLSLFTTRRDDIKRMYRQGIACAERFLYFENQYYKAPEMAEWIVARGRERPNLFVIIVVLADPSDDDGTNPVVSHGVNLQFRTFERIVTGLGPARARLYTMFGRSVHAKFMLADDSFMTIGSANASVRSFEMDSELNVTIGDTGATRDFRRRLWAHNLGKSRAVVDGWAESRFLTEWDAVARANAAKAAADMDGEGVVPFDYRAQPGRASPLIPDPIARLDLSRDRAFPGLA